jgi:hypothetical protein
MSTDDNHDMALVMATDQALLDELQNRGLLTPCTARAFVDGRVLRSHRAETDERIRQNGDEIDADDVVHRHVELQVLEALNQAMVTADTEDRVHTFTLTPAGGDYAPGTLLAEVEMLAVPLQMAATTDKADTATGGGPWKH